MTFRKIASIGLLATAAWAATAGHAAVVVSKDLSAVDNIPGLTGFATSGDQLDGLQVTATFSGGLTQTLFWADTGAGAGGVFGTGWALTEEGDTFSAAWSFVIDPDASLGQLTSLVLDASGPRQVTVFDATNPSFGTDDSAQGRDFIVLSGCSECDGTAVYSNVVAVTPAGPVGDLFHTLTVTFTGGSGPGGSFTFGQDADNDSRLTTGFLPEPGSIALIGVALAALGATTRRRA